MSVDISATAYTQLSKLCHQTGKNVRLSISSGGCQGFSKVWDIVDSIEINDTVFELSVGKLAIDSSSLEILGNAAIDYKNDISGSYFVVDIASAISTCGCGTSFSI